MPRVRPESFRRLALIIDSDVGELRRAMGLVRAAGWSVLGAHDAPEAWALLESFDPALIIADVALPGIAAIAIHARRISALFAALHAEGVAADRIPFRDADIRKPVDSAHLLALVAKGYPQ